MKRATPPPPPTNAFPKPRQPQAYRHNYPKELSEIKAMYQHPKSQTPKQINESLQWKLWQRVETLPILEDFWANSKIGDLTGRAGGLEEIRASKTKSPGSPSERLKKPADAANKLGSNNPHSSVRRSIISSKERRFLYPKRDPIVR